MLRTIVWATLVVVGVGLCACSGTSDPSAPAAATAPSAPAAPVAADARTGRLAPAGVFRETFDRSERPLNEVLMRSQRSGRPTLVLLTTSWCGFCRRLEANTLPDARVQQAAQAFEAVHYDADREPGRSMAARYGVRGYPTLVLLDGQGNLRDTSAGYSEAEIYAAILRQLARGRPAGG